MQHPGSGTTASPHNGMMHDGLVNDLAMNTRIRRFCISYCAYCAQSQQRYYYRLKFEGHKKTPHLITSKLVPQIPRSAATGLDMSCVNIYTTIQIAYILVI
jgi:hypothetical protein